MREIETRQHWKEGFRDLVVSTVFGVRIQIRWAETNATEEVSEDEFRRRFAFVTGG